MSNLTTTWFMICHNRCWHESNVKLRTDVCVVIMLFFYIIVTFTIAWTFTGPGTIPSYATHDHNTKYIHPSILRKAPNIGRWSNRNHIKIVFILKNIYFSQCLPNFCINTVKLTEKPLQHQLQFIEHNIPSRTT